MKKGLALEIGKVQLSGNPATAGETPENEKTKMNTLELLIEALAPTELVLRAEYNRQLTARMEKVLAELAEDGWDARKRFAYPYGTMGKVAYRLQEARYNSCNFYTNGVKGSISMHEPNIRVAKTDNAERIAAQAEKLAKVALEGFCAKLAGKIDATGIAAVSVKYLGGTNPWGWTHILVNSGTTTSQVWRTKMIVNVSCLGKIFNQWPTRQVAAVE